MNTFFKGQLKWFEYYRYCVIEKLGGSIPSRRFLSEIGKGKNVERDVRARNKGTAN